MGRHWQYLKYVVRHKWFVFVAGWKLGIPWLAALHDNSKFLPDEWLPYARHFYEPDGSKKTRKAADGFYRDQANDDAFDRAWLKHIRRNKHHPQHWIKLVHAPCHIGDHEKSTLFRDDDSVTCLACRKADYTPFKFPPESADYTVAEMPDCYRREMLADWIGAGAAQGTPDTLRWYMALGRKHILGELTRVWIETALGVPI